MSSKLTQIALDFGPEPQPQPDSPSVANGMGSSEEDAARPYLAAGGVGVRVKSFKQPAPVPAVVSMPPEAAPEIASRPTAKVINGNLFGLEEPVVEEAPGAEVSSAEASPAEVSVAEAPEVATVPMIAAGEPPVAEVVPPVAEVVPPTRRRTPAGRTSVTKPGTSKRGRKSLKEVAAEAHLIEIPADEVLFSKQYYTMGEVSEMFRVNQSLLRFWETEFDILQPKKNKKGDRHFRPVDIKNLHLIYHLLRQKKYTIEGAKEFLKKNKKADERFEVIQRLQQIKAFLVEWKAQL
jgi:DNA-binding transcriptional MerR regulator